MAVEERYVGSVLEVFLLLCCHLRRGQTLLQTAVDDEEHCGEHSIDGYAYQRVGMVEEEFAQFLEAFLRTHNEQGCERQTIDNYKQGYPPERLVDERAHEHIPEGVDHKEPFAHQEHAHGGGERQSAATYDEEIRHEYQQPQ